MQAVILAGGKGARLGEFTKDLPKPMLKIGEKPVLQHQIELLKKNNISEVIILVNYLKDSIINFFGSGEKWGVSISYYEETEPLGTAGGIREIENLLGNDFLVIYGDVMINMDFRRLIAFHHQMKSQCTLVLHPNNHPFDSDLVEINENKQIVAFHPKPHPEGFLYHNLVSAGVYVFSGELIKYIEKGKKADFGRQIFPVIFDKIRMFGYHTAEYLKDMGTPQRYEEVNHDWDSGRIGKAGYDHKKIAFFLDRDGVLNVEKNFIHRPEELELYSFTPEALQRINQAGYLSVVVTNQSAVARNLCTISELEVIHKKLETELGNKGAWLDAIYYCPHHPDKGYPEENPEFKIDCECRKPKTGMFLKAEKEFNIDLQQSWMIGDSERDIIAGKNAGCKTVGVRTGYGIKKTTVMPDYFFENLKEAVDFIIDEPYKDVFRQMLEKYSSSARKPYIISVAGNARSGKSTFSSYLALKFRENRLKVLKIELDNWILPENKRAACHNVYDRFQLDIITADISKLINGAKICLSTYSNHPERASLPVEYVINDCDIIIIDGIVALSNTYLREIADFKIFMEIPPDVFYQRFVQYYSWRGKTEQEARTLLEKRKSDEYQLIEKESKFADLVINTFNT